MQTVTSRDGTAIAYEVAGSGPAVLPVGTTASDHPTEVVVGEGSEPFFHDGARALVKLLPRATYRILAGQDHTAFWMAPDAVRPRSPGSSTPRPSEPCAHGGGCWW